MIKKCNIQDQSCDFEGGAKTTYPSKASSRARARATQSASYLNGFNSQEQWYSLFYFANMQYWYVFISRKIQGVMTIIANINVPTQQMVPIFHKLLETSQTSKSLASHSNSRWSRFLPSVSLLLISKNSVDTSRCSIHCDGGGAGRVSCPNIAVRCDIVEYL